jgi:hypothetical protein
MATLKIPEPLYVTPLTAKLAAIGATIVGLVRLLECMTGLTEKVD